MKKLILLSGICIFSATTFGQKATVRGIITDTLNQQTLKNTSISLLRTSDSVLYRFTRSKDDGRFELSNIQPGNYILMVNHQAYADYFDHLALKEGQTADLGKVMLSLEAKLLENVTVRQVIAAIRMR